MWGKEAEEEDKPQDMDGEGSPRKKGFKKNTKMPKGKGKEPNPNIRVSFDPKAHPNRFPGKSAIPLYDQFSPTFLLFQFIVCHRLCRALSW